VNILITGVGGPTPRSFAISLKKYSSLVQCNLFATDINPLAIGLYNSDLFEAGYVIPRADDPGYWDAIGKIVKAHAIEYAVILPEFEVLAWSRRMQDGRLPCNALLPDPVLAAQLVNKSDMTEALKELGLVPPSVAFSRDETDLTRITDSLGFPFWVRSASGTSGLGSLKVENQPALRNWIQINPDVKEFLASKFLPGRNLACKLLYHNGDLLRAACAERVNYIMAKVAPSGITGNTSFGRLINEPDLADVAIRAMDHMFKVTGAKKHGFFTVDFKEDEIGKPYITEVNVRHVAFTQCFAAGGANFAEDTMRLLSDDKTFDRSYRYYEFEPDLIFLRDVDDLPVIMKEKDLIKLRR